MDNQYQNITFYLALRANQQEYLKEAERERLIRLARQGQPKVTFSLKLRKVLGYSLIKIGQRVSPELQEA